MKNWARHTPKFIDAVRQLAADGLSSAQAAAEMSTYHKKYTRNAMIGIGHREGFKFHGKSAGRKHGSFNQPRSTQRKPKAWKSSMTISNGPTPHIVAVRKLVVVPQRAVCSWHGCDRHVEEGDMFCSGHNRKGLFA